MAKAKLWESGEKAQEWSGSAELRHSSS